MKGTEKQSERLAAFEFLTQQIMLQGDEVLTKDILQGGFDYKGQRVALMGPQGIFKPAILSEIPLSIRTAPAMEGKPAPYEDAIGEDGRLRYRYRGTDPQHRDNVGLRRAMETQSPLIYLFGIEPGRYQVNFPVYIVGDDPANLTFTASVDEQQALQEPKGNYENKAAEARRAYITVATIRRLHQRTFRQRVLAAYQKRCTICSLRREELLDAAHILPDGHPKGEPIVPNGLALCTLHHTAFDRHLLGIRPDYIVELRQDLLDEADGPTLQHALQGFQGKRIVLPGKEMQRPRVEFLVERYSMFRSAM